MKRRKFLLGSVAALSGTGLIAGTQGYSNVEADREVRITVEDDEDAYLSLVPSVEFGTSVTFECKTTISIQVGNQTPESLNVDISAELQGGSVGLTNGTHRGVSLGTGGSETVSFEPSCDPGEESETDLVLHITGETKSGDVLIEAEREIGLDCECPVQIDGIRMGKGNVEILTTPRGARVEREFYVWFWQDGELTKIGPKELETSRNLQKQFGGTGNKRIIAIAQAGEDQWYRYPPFDPDSCNLETPTPNKIVTEKEDINEC